MNKCCMCRQPMTSDVCVCPECSADVTAEMPNRCVPGEYLVLAYVHPIDGEPYWVAWSESGEPGGGARQFNDAFSAVTKQDEAGASAVG